jgi:hypothetical protein
MVLLIKVTLAIAKLDAVETTAVLQMIATGSLFARKLKVEVTVETGRI